MATFLYRLGRFCARRARLVVVIWVALLAVAGGAYALGHGTLSSAVSIPGTATAQVTDQLRAALPAASGGSGTVVFHTADGSAFTGRVKESDEERASLEVSGKRRDVAYADVKKALVQIEFKRIDEGE